MKQPEHARRIKKLRGALHLTQHTLAERLHVRPQVVASWEQGRREPSASSYRRLVDLAPPKDAWFFLKQIGVTKRLVRAKWPGGGTRRSFNGSLSSPPTTRIRTAKANPVPFVQIPLLREGHPAMPREITTDDIESVIAIPTGDLSERSDAYVGIRHRGEAMAPVLQDGFMVVVDRTIRDPASLAGRIVAAWGEEGLLLRWLAQENAGRKILLRPENSNFPTLSLDAATDRIMGKVIFWWGMQG